MADSMSFPATFDEFAERYKIIDKEEVYTNGAELIPIFRVKQWLEHKADVVEVVRCKDCGSFNKHYKECTLHGSHFGENGFCCEGKRKMDE